MPDMTPAPAAPQATTASQLRLLQIHGGEVSRDVAATLAVRGLYNIKGSASANEVAFMLEAMAVTGQEDAATTTGMSAYRFGIGFRTFYRITKLQADFKLDYGTIGAALSLGVCTARFESHAYGLGADAEFMELLNANYLGGKLTAEIFVGLHTHLIQALHKALKAADPAHICLEKVPVPAKPGFQGTTYVALSMVYGAKRVLAGDSLTNALERMPEGLSQAEIQTIYNNTAVSKTIWNPMLSMR